MIRRVAIKNYRCLRDVELELSPLTVLVGPNASGKSSVLKALVSTSLERSDYWRHQGPPSLELVLVDGTKHSKGDRGWSSRPYTARLVHFDLQQMRSANQLFEQHRLEDNGSNLTNVFGSLTRKEQDQVGKELSARVPVIADVNTRPSANGFHRLLFQDRWAEKVWYEANDVSDGTILMLAYLLLQYEQPPVDLLLVEEPERGLHPYLLEEMLSFMRKLAAGEIGARPTQIVIATHSAELLEYARPEEVRFLSREGEDVVIRSAPTNSPEWENAFREYRESLGSVWLSGSLGGVPGGS